MTASYGNKNRQAQSALYPKLTQGVRKINMRDYLSDGRPWVMHDEWIVGATSRQLLQGGLKPAITMQMIPHIAEDASRRRAASCSPRFLSGGLEPASRTFQCDALRHRLTNPGAGMTRAR